jgi:hypothetical protein
MVNMALEHTKALVDSLNKQMDEMPGLIDELVAMGMVGVINKYLTSIQAPTVIAVFDREHTLVGFNVRGDES